MKNFLPLGGVPYHRMIERGGILQGQTIMGLHHISEGRSEQQLRKEGVKVLGSARDASLKLTGPAFRGFTGLPPVQCR